MPKRKPISSELACLQANFRDKPAWVKAEPIQPKRKNIKPGPLSTRFPSVAVPLRAGKAPRAIHHSHGKVKIVRPSLSTTTPEQIEEKSGMYRYMVPTPKR